MKWPKLVPTKMCHARIVVRIQRGVSVDGSPEYTQLWSGRCSYSERSKNVLNAERQLVRLEATALIDGDIAPGMDIAGEAVVTDEGAPETVRTIYSASRARNPDGTVNYTRLELM